jgi:Cu(I)/Ag(I) efflux system membrane fusion protein
VDAAAGKINLTHEPIDSLSWGVMTMGFTVKNAAPLKNLKPGSQVEFDLQKSGDAYLITRISSLGQSAQKQHVDDPANPHTH